VHDRSTIVVPEGCAAQWHGWGGSLSSSVSAALQLQARVELRTGRLDVPHQEGRASERAALLPGPLPAARPRLADLGYWSLDAVATLEQHQVCWLARLQRQTAVYDATGARQALLTRLETPPTAPVGLAVALGERQRLAARLLAVRVPQDVAETRRRCGRPPAPKAVRAASTSRAAPNPSASWGRWMPNSWRGLSNSGSSWSACGPLQTAA
jgi:hypothetical protein